MKPTLDVPIADRSGDVSCKVASASVHKSRTAAAMNELILALSADLAARMIQLRQKLASVVVWSRRHVSAPLLLLLTKRSLFGLPFRLKELQVGRLRPPAPSSAISPRRLTSIPVIGRFAIAILVLAGVGVLALSSAWIWALHDLPLDRAINKTIKPGLILSTTDGETLGRVGPLKLTEVDRRNFPEHLVQAVLSIEDRRFYSHFGIDLMGIVRAAHRNRIAGEIVQGGSTITQQLVRLRYLNRERSLARKIREALVALRLEQELSKDEILTAYLNSIYVGSDAYGMPAAARIYFNKQISELTLAESAMLAGLIKAPSLLNPLRDLPAARARAAVVLDAMVVNGVIDQAAAATAKSRPATVNLAQELRPASTWLADWVAQQEVAQVKLGAASETMRVRTTLDPKLQLLAEKVVNDVLTKEGSRARVSQAALVALRPDGAVLAMVGGRDYRHSQFNRAVEANRHPGSLFKLFVYLAALRKGYSPHDVIEAGPIEIKNWKPENFGGAQFGRVTLAEAFTRSINTAAVRLAMDVGLNEVISAARDLGIEARLSPVPSLALGAAEVGLLDLTGAFASVRAGRLRVEPWGISAFGYEHEPQMRTIGPPAGPQQAMGQERHAMLDLLRMVVQRGTARAASLDGFAAGKTGTSQNHRDAWFIGFNESLVVGVWVGNDDGTPMKRVVGGTVPAWIWKRFMTEAIPLLGPSSPGFATVPGTSVFARQETTQASRTLLSDADARPQRSEKASRFEQILRAMFDAKVPGQCNIEACSRMYHSFNPADCTYQPYGHRGGRRLCEIGLPSRDAHELVSEQSPPAAEKQLMGSAPSRPTEEGRNMTTEGRGPGQCNIEGCARKYKSFSPADCTYQPYDRSVRRLCEMGAQLGHAQEQPSELGSPPNPNKVEPLQTGAVDKPEIERSRPSSKSEKANQMPRERQRREHPFWFSSTPRGWSSAF